MNVNEIIKSWVETVFPERLDQYQQSIRRAEELSLKALERHRRKREEGR